MPTRAGDTHKTCIAFQAAKKKNLFFYASAGCILTIHTRIHIYAYTYNIIMLRTRTFILHYYKKEFGGGVYYIHTGYIYVDTAPEVYRGERWHQNAISKSPATLNIGCCCCCCSSASCVRKCKHKGEASAVCLSRKHCIIILYFFFSLIYIYTGCAVVRCIIGLIGNQILFASNNERERGKILLLLPFGSGGRARRRRRLYYAPPLRHRPRLIGRARGHTYRKSETVLCVYTPAALHTSHSNQAV